MVRSLRIGARLALPLLLSVCLASVALAGCNARPKRQAPPAAVTVAKSLAKPALTKRPEPRAPLEQFVQQHVEEGDAAGVRVIVYVGATWCEPCKHFHKALDSGELDKSLAGTQFLEFDADRDRDELRAAGYGSKYIPLFTVPDPDGRASLHRIEGSVKGTNAVRDDLVPRLLAMLNEKRPG